ncbi:MAG: 2-dehydropantoate 2-reductase [Verrucomicrobia bacterium]|nr:2-dehydropantoate 2-reductase [Verrucomicrobiota bacterium]
MKIAVAGCGAVGGYYGAKLLRDGRDVHFLLRSDYDIVRRRGVRALSAEGDFHVQPRCARTPEEIGVCDLVLIALKTTANSEFPRLLPPLVGPHTAVMTLQNGLGNEASLAKIFPVAQILGGLCYVCINRTKPGVIQHIAHGRIVMGEHQRWPEPRTHDIAGMFRHAGVPCKVADNLERAHWEKLIWNIPFNGLGVAGIAGFDALNAASGSPSLALQVPSSLGPCLTTDILLADPKWERFVRELIAEVIAAANALGLAVPESLAEKNITNTRTMGAYKASTLIDFERGQPLEIESLFLEPLRQARRAGVNTPRLDALCRVLTALDSARREKLPPSP